MSNHPRNRPTLPGSARDHTVDAVLQRVNALALQAGGPAVRDMLTLANEVRSLRTVLGLRSRRLEEGPFLSATVDVIPLDESQQELADRAIEAAFAAIEQVMGR